MEFGDGPQAHQGRATSGADNRGFGDRRIDHTFWAELVDDAVSDFEGAAIGPDIFANEEDSGVAFHLFPQALTNSFHHGRQTATRRPFEFVFFLDRGRHCSDQSSCRKS